MRTLSALLLLLALVPRVAAQVPTKCFEIESILVDACNAGCPGADEQDNEMVRFITGPDPLLLSGFNITWPTALDGWLLFEQNAGTAATTAAINATIEGCGHLIEPPGAVIPAGKQVILVTSTAMCPMGNSFAALNDTLYIIYQNAGNGLGHFANSGSGLRTFIMRYTPSACSDTITYDRALLVDQSGVPGAQDGATVEATWPGTPVLTYTNNGCQAPFIPGGPVTITGDTMLCGQFATTVLTAHGADTYVWSTGATGPAIVAAISGPISYWVAGTSACGTDTAYISVHWMNHTTFYENVSCNGAADGTLSLQGNHGVEPYTYSWSTSSDEQQITGLAPGTYSYTITDSDGCSQSGSYTITEPTPLVLTVGNDTTICAGGFAVLNAEGSGGTPAYSFTWSPEGPLVFPTATTTYSVVIEDQHGCTLPPQDLTVTVGGGSADFSTEAVGDCAPVCVTFTSSTQGDSYTWDFGDGNSGSGEVTDHCYTAAGSYDITLTVEQDGSDCPSVTTVAGLVQVPSSNIVADISASPTAGMAPLDVDFTNNTVPATATSDWAFGDGAVSTDNGPSHTYTDPGTYMVVMRATEGCSDADTLYILVMGAPIEVDSSWVLVPNVISPNGDRSNDAFRVSSNGLRSLTVDIFNRWGQQMGDIRQINGSWNGRSLGGEPAPAGTYFYILQAQGLDGRTYDLHGAFSLLR